LTTTVIDLIQARGDIVVTTLIDDKVLKLPTFLPELPTIFLFALMVVLVMMVGALLSRYIFRKVSSATEPISLFVLRRLSSMTLVTSVVVFLLIGITWALLHLPGAAVRDRLWAALLGSALVILLLALPLCYFVVRASGEASWLKKFALAALAISPLVLVLYPLSGRINDTFWWYRDRLDEWTVLTFVLVKISYLFSQLPDFVPYIIFLGALPFIRTLDKSPDERSLTSLALEKLLFAAYVVGVRDHFYLIPIPFLLAFVVYPRIIAQGEERARLDFLKVKTPADEPCQTDQPDLGEAKEIDLDVLRDAQQGLTKKLRSWDVSPAKFRRENARLQRLIDRSEQRKLVLGIGPYEENWKNAAHASKYGFWLALLLSPIYVGLTVMRDTSAPRFALLSLVTGAITTAADWVILAFFFGYCFKYIRGTSGLRKGVYLAAAYTVCLLPVWLVNLSTSPVALALFILPNFIFLPVLGIWAFDLPKLRSEKKPWSTLIQLEDLPAFLAFSSVPITSLAVALISFLTGGYKEVIPLLIKLASTAVPAVPR
jgi:hypothetical protein